MLNQINKFLKIIYVYIAFRITYNWAELLFPNRLIYATMLMSDCYTMKQFRDKNLKLLNYISLFGDLDRYEIKSSDDLINKIATFNKTKQECVAEHHKEIKDYIENDLGVSLD